jgi:hypothetical protein
MPVLGGVAVSYEQGTPVEDLEFARGTRTRVSTPSRDSQSDFAQVTSTYDQVSTLGGPKGRHGIGTRQAALWSITYRGTSLIRNRHSVRT